MYNPYTMYNGQQGQWVGAPPDANGNQNMMAIWQPNAQQPQGPTGANREGMGWRQSRREQQGQLANQQGRMDRMQNRMNTLQERYKGAGSDQQAGIQGRMDALQGRMDKVQGNMGDPNATGADRAGMGWRKERRQAKNAGTYDPQAQGGQPEPAMYQTPNLNRGQGNGYMNYMDFYGNQGGGGLLGGMGMGGMGFGGFGGFGGFPQGNYAAAMNVAPGQGRGGPMMGQAAAYGGITDSMSGNMTGATPVAPYNPTAQPQAQGGGWNPLTQATGMGNMFETSFGRLVPSSVGNQNVFQREGDASTLYNFNPTQGWKSMTPEEYRGYGETNYADPRQYAAANPMMQQWTQRNGLIQGMQGTGAYA